MTDVHAHSHDHHHHHGEHHHSSEGGIINWIGTVLHLPGFGHAHDHRHNELAQDSAIHDNAIGIRTIWLALLALGITTALQIGIYIISGSVALLADTVHNLGGCAQLDSALICVLFVTTGGESTLYLWLWSG